MNTKGMVGALLKLPRQDNDVLNACLEEAAFPKNRKEISEMISGAFDYVE